MGFAKARRKTACEQNRHGPYFDQCGTASAENTGYLLMKIDDD